MPKLGGVLWDYRGHPIHRRQKLAARTARRLGLITLAQQKAHFPALPKNLCQQYVADERARGLQAAQVLIDAAKRNEPVFQVTVCHPAWMVEAGCLRPEVFKEVRDWVTRRARALSIFGQQRLLGCVDLAWQDRREVGGRAHWSAHAHMAVTVEGYDVAKDELHQAFHAPPLPPGYGPSVLVQPLSEDLDVLRATEYASRAMLLDVKRNHKYYSSGGKRHRSLAALLDSELAEVYLAMGPKALWLLSGFRRSRDGIVVHNGQGSSRR